MSETYRSYNSFVPEFLRGRPRSVIIYCLQRMKKSQRFTNTDIEFRNETNGLFHLKSLSGKVHVVDFGITPLLREARSHLKPADRAHTQTTSILTASSCHSTDPNVQRNFSTPAKRSTLPFKARRPRSHTNH